MDKFKRWSKRKRVVFLLLAATVVLYAGMILWHTFKPLPEGVSFAGDLQPISSLDMVTDLTYATDKEGENRQTENEIFDSIYAMINEAEEFVVVDFFLVDGFYEEDEGFPAIAEELSETLATKKQQNPDMPVIFITDPLNKGYGSYENEWFKKMRDADVEIVYTDLDPLRDSTPIYSGIYRSFFQWFDLGGEGWIPNAMASEAPKMTIASYLTLLNVKANHRKLVITEKQGLVSSANPHDASGLHGNIALQFTSTPLLNDMLEAEEAVSLFSGGPKLPRVQETDEEAVYEGQFLTEKKILDALLTDIAATEEGDSIDLMMFFIAKRDIVTALIDAANRGVDVRMILDPNENSFGRQKSGLPNRPVVQEMVEDTDGKLEVRWYNTVVGQYHTKAIHIKTDRSVISSGAANYTERTLDNYNLEANLRVIATSDSELTADFNSYFERLWNNEDAEFTVDVEEYQDSFTWWQRWIYSFQKLIKVTTY
ncbi:phospholipase D family protein [Chryseomicrobium sp. FSL W7-1435]|uniref:phospholipase D family protein n=1 Tax=Chryseomicrobium sp. FSL W7-1435 TaxID=2921704 RepID=UPI00315ACDFD